MPRSGSGTTVMMRVEFYRSDEGRLCGWIATPPHRRAFQGTTMAAGRSLPHDLTQFVRSLAPIMQHS
jgi:hypothetical protein